MEIDYAIKLKSWPVTVPVGLPVADPSVLRFFDGCRGRRTLTLITPKEDMARIVVVFALRVASDQTCYSRVSFAFRVFSYLVCGTITSARVPYFDEAPVRFDDRLFLSLEWKWAFLDVMLQ